MAQEVGVEIKTTITKSNGNNMRIETIAYVQEFYDSNDIYWQASCRKDFIIISTMDQDGEKSN